MDARARFRAYGELSNRGKRAHREPMHDADIVILTLLLAPAFLAVLVWTLFQGQPVGAGATICGALVVLAVAMGASA
jgi:hypothetical protein